MKINNKKFLVTWEAWNKHSVNGSDEHLNGNCESGEGIDLR